MSDARPPIFVSAGEVMVELGSTDPVARAERFWRSYSGDVLNIAVAIQRLGLPTSMLTKLGEDPFGDYLLAEWQQLGVDLRYVSRGGGPTGLYFAEFAPDSHYDIWYYRKGSAASTIAPADIDALSLEGIRLVHLSGISQAISDSSRSATRRLAERATEASIDISFDMNYRPQIWPPEEARAAAREVLPLTDLVFLGVPDESRILLDETDPEAAGAALLDLGARAAVLTMAEDGAYVAWPDGSVRLPHTARGTDTLQGAGDAFAGGFSAGWLLGASPATCARLGTVTAGLKVERLGALAGLPHAHEVIERAQELGWTDVAAALAAAQSDAAAGDRTPAAERGDAE